MRTGLIAALARTDTGALRAELPLAGRSVLGWQVALLRELGAERIVCLCNGAAGEILRLQHEVEASGAGFHALTGFAALPALVRAEDELIILRDGLVPDSELVRTLVGVGPMLQKGVACLRADHRLAAAFPEDFERIDAAHCWAGLLVMRGAPVQQLADFPGDSDPVSVLLRLALQAGTPCRILEPQTWLLADSAQTMAAHEAALIAAAVPAADWRAPMTALAATLVRNLAPRGIGQGARIAAAAALALMVGGVVAAALDAAAIGLALAGAGAFAAQACKGFAGLARRLRRADESGRSGKALDAGVDGFAALTAWFALSPWPDWTPLAVCGPLAIGLARVGAVRATPALAAIASDRASLLLALALAAWGALLPEANALIAAGLLGALLLRNNAD